VTGLPRVALVCTLLSVAACSGDKGARDVDQDAESDSSRSRSRSADAGGVPDPGDAATNKSEETTPVPTTSGSNVSFETAWPIDVKSRGVLQDVRSASQVDYFVFEAEAGKFYELATGRRNFGPDNVMTLFDPHRQPIAENDDGPRFPGDAIDARLVVRAAHSGKYYVRLEDTYTPPDVFSNPSYPLLYYRFWVRELGAGVEGAAHAKVGQSRQVELVRDETSGYDCAILFGEFTDGETDVFALSGQADHALIGHVHTAGEHGDGSTTTAGVVSVLDAQHHPLARIVRGDGRESIHPPLSDAEYELTVAGGGDPGTNGFYALDVVLLPDNPRESDDARNGTPQDAETIEMPGSPQRRGLLLSTLPDDDVDYYQFEALAGDAITVACEGESGGSGVRDLRVELRDRDGTTLLAGIESPDENLQLEGLEITTPTTLFLRLSGEGADAESGEAFDVEPWARCVVIAGP
jgi:hypothetical protein